MILRRALANHQNLLGSNFENLGKGIYLSYDRTKGWSVENFTGCLGFIKRALRWLGIFYTSTHLKNIAPQIQREVDVPRALLNKINACWRKKGGLVLVREVPNSRSDRTPERLDNLFDNRENMTDYAYNEQCKRIAKDKEEALRNLAKEITRILPINLSPPLGQ